ncbi:hypothetical protein SCHPADRAFT_992351 [Schizopora paradoxa]|uniref:Uncharacterized protein n=1 Tax=Schizopora paradoxa TaxID=27342 RepID=A0A0H2S7N7_9AGAM|nr:hypothetical protein SCHPADRAFT_992351 [Schizopora paradoxa]
MRRTLDYLTGAVLILAVTLTGLIEPVSASTLLGNKWEATNFCKCICFGTNYTILHLALPDNPSKPCLSCTKQWCLNQNLPICAGADLGETDPDSAPGKKGDVEARCFQRDSPRDQLVVTLFLLTVFGLLLGAGIKGKMLKAGFDTSALAWNSGGRRWWEFWTPRSRPDSPLLAMTSRDRSHSRSRSNGDANGFAVGNDSDCE